MSNRSNVRASVVPKIAWLGKVLFLNVLSVLANSRLVLASFICVRTLYGNVPLATPDLCLVFKQYCDACFLGGKIGNRKVVFLIGASGRMNCMC